MTYAFGSTSNSASSNTIYGSTFTLHIHFQQRPRPRPKRRYLNPYTVLGLPNRAPMEQVRSRYRALAKVLHPDAGGDVKWMAVLNRAYDFICKEAEQAA